MICKVNVKHTLGGKTKSPLIGPFKGINKEYKGVVLPMFHIKCRVLKLRFLTFSRGPGGFRELREASRSNFQPSWYLDVSMVRSCGQKASWGNFLLPSTECMHVRAYIR